MKRASLNGPVNRTFLITLVKHLGHNLGVLSVDELSEGLLASRITNDLGPLAVVGTDEHLHLLLEILADTELVVDNDLLKTLETAGNFSIHRAVRSSLSAERM